MCVCACVCMCVHVCVNVRACVLVRTRVCACVRDSARTRARKREGGSAIENERVFIFDICTAHAHVCQKREYRG